jgi:hypothetical protein
VIATPEQMQKFNKWSRKEIEDLDVELAQEWPTADDLTDLLDCLRCRRYADAIAQVEALLFPKFKTLAECEAKYKALKSA